MFGHSIFSRFDRVAATQDGEFFQNFMGLRVRKAWDCPVSVVQDGVGFTSGASADNAQDPTLPSRLSEDYYEWISLLEAIADAKDQFVMIDLGAGYGRWALNGLLAVKCLKPSKDLKSMVFAVEADRTRFDWMAEAFRINNIPAEDYELIKAGISDRNETAVMVTGPHEFGASVLQLDKSVSEYIEKNNVEVINAAEGGQLQTVKTIPLIDIVGRAASLHRVIDFVDMDIQGAEVPAVPSAIALMNNCVKRMHISTHNPLQEEILYNTLISNGWAIKRFYRRETANFAEFGRFLFDDGVIYCVNSRLC